MQGAVLVGPVVSGTDETMKYDPRSPVWVLYWSVWRHIRCQNTRNGKMYWNLIYRDTKMAQNILLGHAIFVVSLHQLLLNFTIMITTEVSSLPESSTHFSSSVLYLVLQRPQVSWDLHSLKMTAAVGNASITEKENAPLELKSWVWQYFIIWHCTATIKTWQRNRTH